MRQAARTAEAEAKAEAKAQRLLYECLDESQAKDFRMARGFVVISNKGRKYYVAWGTTRNVTRWDDQGRLIETLCIHPADVPIPDTMLAQKLLLETDEDVFRRIANITRHRGTADEVTVPEGVAA